MKQLRGQSALEYLVTYGWAILAIVVVAAVLWYFGVFNPGQFASSSASARGFGDVGVRDQIYNSTALTLILSNAVGQNIYVTGVSLDGTAGTVTATNLAAGRDQQVIVIGASAINDCTTSGASYDVAMIITYTNNKTGLAGKTTSGTIKGTCG